MKVDLSEYISKALGAEANRVMNEVLLKELTEMNYETYTRTHEGECYECGQELEEVSGNALWPNRDDLAPKRFLVCWYCSAWVGLNDEGVPKGYPAREHIRELRKMILNSWFKLSEMGVMSWQKAEEFRSWLRKTHNFDISDMGWLDEEQLRLLLRILDKRMIPDTPAIDALFI